MVLLLLGRGVFWWYIREQTHTHTHRQIGECAIITQTEPQAAGSVWVLYIFPVS